MPCTQVLALLIVCAEKRLLKNRSEQYAAQGFGPNELNRPHLHRTQINHLGSTVLSASLFDVISNKVEMKRFCCFHVASTDTA